MKNLTTLFAALGLVCAFGCAPEAPAPAPAPAPTHEEAPAADAPAADAPAAAPAETPAAAPEGGSTAN